MAGEFWMVTRCDRGVTSPAVSVAMAVSVWSPSAKAVVSQGWLFGERPEGTPSISMTNEEREASLADARTYEVPDNTVPSSGSEKATAGGIVSRTVTDAETVWQAYTPQTSTSSVAGPGQWPGLDTTTLTPASPLVAKAGVTIAPISRGAPSANRAAIVSRCGAPASVCVETVKLAEPVSGKLAAGGEIEAAKLRVAALFCTTTCTDPLEPRFPAASYA